VGGKKARCELACSAQQQPREAFVVAVFTAGGGFRGPALHVFFKRWNSAVLHVFIRRETRSGLYTEHYHCLEGVLFLGCHHESFNTTPVHLDFHVVLL